MKTAEKDKYKFICFTNNGQELAERILRLLSGTREIVFFDDELDSFTRKNFSVSNVLVFIGAAGIAVRAIAPYISDKTTDPAVLVIDEKGCFVIPILSGHIGGAVKEAKKISGLIGATAVITTATDINGEFAVDVFAIDNDMFISDMEKAKEYTAKLLRDGKNYYGIDEEFSDYICVNDMPDNIEEDGGREGFIISPKKRKGGVLQLIPRCIVIGMGCRKDVPGDVLYEFCLEKLRENNIDPKAVKVLVSIDLKRDEKGMIDIADKLKVPFMTFTPDSLNAQKGSFKRSSFVKEVTGVDNVCERAVAAYGIKKLLVKKTSSKGMTFAAGIIDIKVTNKR